jgi:hypothetical protein
MTSSALRRVMTSNTLGRMRGATARVVFATGTMLFVAHAAHAQTINYTATVPIAKVLPNPCYAAFELINGTMNVAITTVQSTDFKLQIKVTSTGRGDDADATGLLLPTGAPYFEYSSDVAADASFPDGKPTYFSHTLTVTDYLARVGSTTDYFIMSAVLNLGYTYGVPSTATLESISVSCQ